MGERASWNFDEGDEIAPGRSVLRELGGGTRYEVQLVWDEARFALMVAKVLRPDVAEDPHALEELREEATALATLAHPVVVRGFDAVTDGPYPHLLIEHLEGPPLRRLLKAEKTLGLQQIVPLALHVAAALAYMEQAGWVHLDVKPDNIVMGVPPRLIDLSIARTVEHAARTLGTLGTDRYMAPEQCGTEEFAGRLGPAADVFGLAATVWRAATGDAPFPRARGDRDAPEPERRYPQLVGDRPQPPRDMPEALAEVLLAGLAREPEDRPAIRTFARGFEPLLEKLPVKAPRRRGRT